MFTDREFDFEDFINNPDKYQIVINDHLGFCVMSKRSNIEHMLKTVCGYRAGYMGAGVDYFLKRYGDPLKWQLEGKDLEDHPNCVKRVDKQLYL